VEHEFGRAMQPDADPLAAIRAALTAMSKSELESLCVAVEEGPLPSSLRAYFTRIATAELDRRKRRATALPPPPAAIPYAELGATFALLATLLAHFQEKPHLRALLAAIGHAVEAEAPASPTRH